MPRHQRRVRGFIPAPSMSAANSRYDAQASVRQCKSCEVVEPPRRAGRAEDGDICRESPCPSLHPDDEQVPFKTAPFSQAVVEAPRNQLGMARSPKAESSRNAPRGTRRCAAAERTESPRRPACVPLQNGRRDAPDPGLTLRRRRRRYPLSGPRRAPRRGFSGSTMVAAVKERMSLASRRVRSPPLP